jgi:hypothetical protein
MSKIGHAEFGRIGLGTGQVGFYNSLSLVGGAYPGATFPGRSLGNRFPSLG